MAPCPDVPSQIRFQGLILEVQSGERMLPFAAHRLPIRRAEAKLFKLLA
jgi:hypothetical protein